MEELSVKNVPFCGSELLAIQEKTSGKIYAGINVILREFGFSEKQIEYRRDKWKDDKVIGRGVLKFSGTLIGAGTGKETWCIDIMKLPLALAKIEITKKLKQEMPELSEKLEKYQEDCADVLAAAFLPKYKENEIDLSPVDIPLGELASYLKIMDRVANRQNLSSYKIAENFKKVSEQFGVQLSEDFVNVPEYVQQTLKLEGGAYHG